MEFSADLVDNRLWLGSIESISQNIALKQLGITHVLSLIECDVQVDDKTIVHKRISIEDLVHTDLLVIFDMCSRFIDDGLRTNPNSNVLVHCQAGASRSASIVCMWLMSRYKLTVEKSLERMKQARREVSPNEGFQAQLHIFEQMNFSFDANHRLYKEFLCERLRELYVDYDTETNGVEGKIELRSKLCQSIDELCRLDESKHRFEYFCRHCCQIVFTDTHLSKHPSGQGIWNWFRNVNDRYTNRLSEKNPCQQKYFTVYLHWFPDQINRLTETNEIRLECQNCHNLLGFLKLQGSKCQCGRWNLPSFNFNEESIVKRDVEKNESIS